MRPLLIQLNTALRSIINWWPDKRMAEPRENLCCRRFKKMDFISCPAVGIVMLRVNYCPCCGKILQRDSGQAGMTDKGTADRRRETGN